MEFEQRSTHALVHGEATEHRADVFPVDSEPGMRGYYRQRLRLSFCNQRGK